MVIPFEFPCSTQNKSVSPFLEAKKMAAPHPGGAGSITSIFNILSISRFSNSLAWAWFGILLSRLGVHVLALIQFDVCLLKLNPGVHHKCAETLRANLEIRPNTLLDRLLLAFWLANGFISCSAFSLFVSSCPSLPETNGIWILLTTLLPVRFCRDLCLALP